MKNYAYDPWCVGLHFLQEYEHVSASLTNDLSRCEFHNMIESESKASKMKKETKYLSKTITNTLV